MSWNTLRSQFPITRRWAFFDHAAVAPLPEPARQAFHAWVDDITENGDVHEGDWARRIEDARALAGRLLNADPLDVAFVKNTSEGIGFVAEGLPWRQGDNVVLAEDEYPANVYPWMNLHARGVEVRRVPGREGRILVDDIRAAMDEHTRLVSISFVEFATGFRNDVDAIGELCRSRGVLFFLDAIQGLGVLPLDVSQTPVDFLAADGHKWLLSPQGAGIFYLRRELVERLHPVSVGWNSVVRPLDFSTIDFRLKPNAGRWENGTLNTGGIVALAATLQMLLDTGVDRIAGRVRELTDHLCEQAQGRGYGVYSSRREGEWSGIVSLQVPGDLRALVKRCRDEGIVVNRRAGRLRVSPHCYNTVEELDHLFEVLGATA